MPLASPGRTPRIDGPRHLCGSLASVCLPFAPRPLRNLIMITIVIISIIIIIIIIINRTQRSGLWPMGKTHIFEKPIQIHWKTQYAWQVPFPKTTHKITTNIKHQNQQTFEDNIENTLLTKNQRNQIQYSKRGIQKHSGKTKTLFKLL